MYITKKRWQALVKRVADLEGQVQSQQVEIKTDVNNHGVLIRTNRIISKSL